MRLAGLIELIPITTKENESSLLGFNDSEYTTTIHVTTLLLTQGSRVAITFCFILPKSIRIQAYIIVLTMAVSLRQ